MFIYVNEIHTIRYFVYYKYVFWLFHLCINNINNGFWTRDLYRSNVDFLNKSVFTIVLLVGQLFQCIIFAWNYYSQNIRLNKDTILKLKLNLFHLYYFKWWTFTDKVTYNTRDIVFFSYYYYFIFYRMLYS